MSTEPKRGRTGGRAGRQAARLAAHVEHVPYLTRTLQPYEVVNEEGLATIEHNADTILEEVGVIVRDHPETVARFAAAGADVDGDLVRFPRGMCRSIVQATAPSIYTQHARNPARNVRIGGDAMVFAPNYGSPFAHDLDNGRRYATLTDFENFVKLAYRSPNLHHSGGTVCEPVDVPVNKRHLDMVYAHLRYSDKPFMGSVTAGSRAADSVEMARIGFGGDLGDRTVMTSLINAASPLVWDASMLAAAEVYAAANQATIITPFILAGAMAPVTTAGVAAQTLAEALAGMAFVQLVRPGAPVVFGSFASSMSMQTGAPTFGTPEPSLVLYVVAQLARRLGVPFRSGGALCASKLPDAQGAYESANTLQATVLGGVNFVLHAAGWLEGGLSIGYEKFVLDDDQLGMMATFVRGVDLSPNGQALDAIRENGPGQHFLGTAHTLANFETAFYRSTTADNASYEQWVEDGGLDAAQRANKIWKDQLAAYEAPPIDDAVDEELRAFVARRKSEMPDELG
ncbi:MAG TPA: trimethylamine methyltransferase family protein [Ilumatobacteraceae bacterium]|nr:trimethylamine methyltransferase family protein [Ilumatobacteraceae bacterium]